MAEEDAEPELPAEGIGDGAHEGAVGEEEDGEPGEEKEGSHDAPGEVASEHECEPGYGADELGREDAFSDFEVHFPHEVAGDEVGDEEDDDVVGNELGAGESADDFTAFGGGDPDEGHGEGGDEVGEEPDHAGGAVGEAVLEVDEEEGFDLAVSPGESLGGSEILRGHVCYFVFFWEWVSVLWFVVRLEGD